MPKWPDCLIGEYLLEAVNNYSTLLCFDSEDKPGIAVVNALLKRAGYENRVDALINKQFIPVGMNFQKAVVVYVHDQAYMVCSVDAERLETYLRRRYSKAGPGVLDNLPPI
jgi:hypothetical protein